METKKCFTCKKIKYFKDFCKHKARPNGITNTCKDCKNRARRADYATWDKDKLEARQEQRRLIDKQPKHVERRKKYMKENKHLFKAYSAQRRARKLKATPKWADLQGIKFFYIFCPEGYHVDHIVPLQGKNVCGLHILSNIQYLTAEENLKKSNKF